MSFFLYFLHFFLLAKGFSHVLGLGTWPHVPAACSWFVPRRCLPGPGPVDVDVDADVDVDVDAEADAGGRRRRRRDEYLCYTLAGTGKGTNIKDNIKQ